MGKRVAVEALVFLAAGSFIGALTVQFRNREVPIRQWPADGTGLIASATVLVLSSALVLFRPRLGYAAALLAGLIALSSLGWHELSNFPRENTWIAFNISDADGQRYLIVAMLRILAVTLSLLSMVLASLRLLSARWTVWKTPIRERTWPAFAATALVLAAWFGYSVVPYRIPGAVHPGVEPALRILHVEKRGLQFRETAISVFEDGRFTTWNVSRRLFEYRFTGFGGVGVMPRALQSRALALDQLLPKDGDKRPNVLRAWRADGWYVLVSRSLISFDSEYQLIPPKEVINVFNDIRKEGLIAYQQKTERDVCLGFCYGPVAALGFVYENRRCDTSQNGATSCQ